MAREAMNRNALKEQLVRHEGLRKFPYTDTVGKLTIGCGRNLTDRGISHATAEQMLDEDIDLIEPELKKFPFWDSLNEVRQRVLADMAFNMGMPTLKTFTGTLTAISEGNYDKAATHMLLSKWAGQVGQRAKTLAKMMREGRE